MYDVAVLGGGIGGVTAAVRARETGASVVLVEAREALGGTALYSGGGVHIWSAETWEEYRRYCPQAPQLARTMVETYPRFVEWILRTRAPGSWGTSTFRGVTLTKYQIGYAFVPEFKLRWFAYFGEKAGDVILGTRVTSLERLGRRRYRIRGTNGLDFLAQNVILALGGWQADPRQLANLTGATPRRFVPRAVPENIGDGVRLAASVGAAVDENGTFYGHLLPAPPCRVDWTSYIDPGLLTAFYAEDSIVLNASGDRFADEGAGELNGETVNLAARQGPGCLWVVFDAKTRRESVGLQVQRAAFRWSHRRYVALAKYLRIRHRKLVIDTLQYAVDRGAVVHKASSIEKLAETIGPNAAATILAFNQAVWEGRTAGLPVPRADAPNPIADPPFYAVEVAVGVSMTYGGVVIDEHARALDHDREPIPGLHAVPGTAGGVHDLHYGGSLAPAGVFGMIAGETATGVSCAR